MPIEMRGLEKLDCGDLVVEDVGPLGVNVMSKDGKLQAFFNAHGVAELRRWLEGRDMDAGSPIVEVADHELACDWPGRFELAREVAEAIERDLVRELERLRGERDRLADRLNATQRNLERSRAQYDEMTTARNRACSLADDAVQLRDDADGWFKKIDEIRKIGF
jgi:hypothetical protein